MRSVYKVGSYKSGPVVVRTDRDTRRFAQLSGENKGAKWKRPCTKKTAADLLYQDDDRPGILNADQRAYLVSRAGDNYKKRDPFLKRSDESQVCYIRRINKMFAGPTSPVAEKPEPVEEEKPVTTADIDHWTAACLASWVSSVPEGK